MLVCLISSNVNSQSIDEKIGDAMNTSDWFALDSIYKITPKDSINPFLEVFSRCLIGNRLNRTDISIPAFQELLNSQSLDLGNLISSAHMFGMDLSREGHNAEAASMIRSIVGQTQQYLDSATVDGLTCSANRYAALAEHNPYRIQFPENDIASIPFNIVPAGPKDKNSVLLHLRRSFINGIEADITFDTGAGVNMISPEFADKYNLIPLDGTRQTVAGVGKSDGYIAIAEELRMGDIIVKDVPFVVASLSSNNEEADQYIGCFSIVVGSELMLQLKELTFDFIRCLITIPAKAPARTDATPNMCFSNGMNLLTRGLVHNLSDLMCIDSGDASFGSLSARYYERYKEHIESVGRLDSIRSAGVGGVTIMPCYHMPDLSVTIGGTTVTVPDLVVKTQKDNSAMAQNVNIGLRTLMLFSKVRFNMVDFVLTTEPYTTLTSLAYPSRYNLPDFKYSRDIGPNLLQTLGFIGVAVTRALVYPTAPGMPDL